MIHPLPSAILATVIESIDKVLRPGLEETLAQAAPESVSRDKLHLSVVITMRHMLRFAELRMAEDPRTVEHEIEMLASVFAVTAAFLDIVQDDDAGALAVRLHDTISSIPEGSAAYTIPDARARHVGRMRLVLHDTLRMLTRRRDDLRDRPGYADCRQIIRDYMSWQLEAESNLIDNSIAGPDYRR